MNKLTLIAVVMSGVSLAIVVDLVVSPPKGGAGEVRRPPPARGSTNDDGTPALVQLPMVQMALPRVLPGVQQPVVWNAEQASVSQATPVLGVVVNGQPRAYLIAAFEDPQQQVVNDTLGGMGVAVAVVDNLPPHVLSRGDGRPVNLRRTLQATFLFEGRTYAASDPQLPLLRHKCQRTTWQQWLQRHPQSDIYVGSADDLPIAARSDNNRSAALVDQDIPTRGPLSVAGETAASETAASETAASETAAGETAAQPAT